MAATVPMTNIEIYDTAAQRGSVSAGMMTNSASGCIGTLSQLGHNRAGLRCLHGNRQADGRKGQLSVWVWQAASSLRTAANINDIASMQHLQAKQDAIGEEPHAEAPALLGILINRRA